MLLISGLFVGVVLAHPKYSSAGESLNANIGFLILFFLCTWPVLAHFQGFRLGRLPAPIACISLVWAVACICVCDSLGYMTL
jgi:hypothetical protein